MTLTFDELKELYDETPEIIIELDKDSSEEIMFTEKETLMYCKVCSELIIEKVLQNLYDRGLTVENYIDVYSGKVIIKENSNG